MVETLLEHTAEWLSGEGPEGDLVFMSECRLARNLADFPFTAQCTRDERRHIMERVTGFLESLNLDPGGQVWDLDELDEREQRFLAERRLIAIDHLNPLGPRSVYISEDQSFSISINEDNHVALRALTSGLRPQEVWARLSLTDDSLAGGLDYAFDDRLGFLTASLGEVGTGLKVAISLHLPALAMANELSSVEKLCRERRHIFSGVVSPKSDLYTITNLSTLGRSEEETVFHVRHLAGDLVARERDARARFFEKAPLHLEDRVGRALGIARGARLLAFNEALSVLSSLRLGVSANLLDQFTVQTVNDVFMSAQDAHLELKKGQNCDELTLNAERAELFRARFT